MQVFRIKTDQFEGPLGLLLEMIKSRKLLINEISLSTIADEYIEYISERPEYVMAHNAEFLVIASTLLLLKSKSLLSQLMLTNDEEEDVQELQRRLKLYDYFQTLAKDLKISFFGSNSQYRKSKASKITQEIKFAPDNRTDIANLHKSMMQLNTTLPKPKKEYKASMKKIVSLQEMTMIVYDRVKNELQFSFTKFTENRTREDTIVGFLAVLELFKQGNVSLMQDQRYEDITVCSCEVATPVYK